MFVQQVHISEHLQLGHISLAAFPSTYFYAHFRISHEKTLDGNGKMRINYTNAHKKHMRTFE